MRQAVPWIVTALAALLAGWVILAWLSREARPVTLRRAEPSGSLAEASAVSVASREPELAGCFKADRAVPKGTAEGYWPGFRGPARDNVAAGEGVLVARWPAEGPRV
ncbi:MAG: hypothetical protein PHV28_17645, partial [Kiritimatiellae bacterium]|nr:hypothetical protein [Kiritimatiellia bacterium]